MYLIITPGSRCPISEGTRVVAYLKYEACPEHADLVHSLGEEALEL